MTRSLQVILVLSVIVNCLLVGYLIGSRVPHPGTPRFMPHERFEKMPIEQAQKRKLQKQLHELRRENRPLMEQMKHLRGEMFRKLSEESFDEQAFQQHLQEMAALKNAMHQRFTQGLIAILKGLNQEERRAFIHHLDKHPGFGPPRPPGSRGDR